MSPLPVFVPSDLLEYDPFDQLLNMACSVWKQIETNNAYGQPVTTYQLLKDDVPCFAEQTSGKELNVPPAPSSETSMSVTTWMIYLRPLFVDDPPEQLSHKHYLELKRPGEETIDANSQQAVRYNITDVDNPGFLDHHFEVTATVIRS